MRRSPGRPRDERARQFRFQLGVAVVQRDRAPKGLERFVRVALRFERRGHAFGTDRPSSRTRARAAVRRRRGRRRTAVLDLVVVRVESGGFAKDVEGLGLASFVGGELGGDLLEIAQSAGLVAHFDAGTGRFETRVEVVRVERSEAHLGVSGAAGVAPPLAQLDQRIEVRPRVGQQLLTGQQSRPTCSSACS